MSAITQKKIFMTNNFGFYYPIIFLVMAGVFINALSIYNDSGFSRLTIRDITLLSIMALAVILQWFKIIDKTQVCLVLLYTLICSIFFSVFLVYPGEALFELFFLKVEIIILVIIFLMGTYVPPINKIVLLGCNIVFIIMCILFLKTNYPIEKFIFYAILVSGCGYLGYINIVKMLRMSNENIKVNELVMKQNAELLCLTKFKDDMFKIIGHDVRTPFSQITSLLNLYEAATTESERKQYIKYIRESSNQGNELLENLLSWAKGQNSMNKEPDQSFLLSELVQSTYAFFEQSLQEKKISLINKITDFGEVCFHKKTLETVLRNIVSNAIKFVNKGGNIELKSKIEGGYLNIYVTDNGIGITSEAVKTILDSETTYTTKGTLNEKGTGLGLKMCKELMVKKNGKLEITSALNKGTTVIIFVPLKKQIENLASMTKRR